jgi:gas vesicle protein
MIKSLFLVILLVFNAAIHADGSGNKNNKLQLGLAITTLVMSATSLLISMVTLVTSMKTKDDIDRIDKWGTRHVEWVKARTKSVDQSIKNIDDKIKNTETDLRDEIASTDKWVDEIRDDLNAQLTEVNDSLKAMGAGLTVIQLKNMTIHADHQRALELLYNDKYDRKLPSHLSSARADIIDSVACIDGCIKQQRGNNLELANGFEQISNSIKKKMKTEL